ncbi:uncharacterized protein EV422DRAFT_491734 [Fimicolochytrium jonesii]|uniref:uncharacterized protein n=1 Tax=Fimicolochytrium jonesii TaxID=1396493 RepID=UPI0022FE20E6|nr:uncharacterized protein EV422DRAFT_491734 [Fimicolochytrium jonesii]KAI8826009.1 hypothetical protein EV422DRAFT_491734 [Fimicolochytrium jonesii]
MQEVEDGLTHQKEEFAIKIQGLAMRREELARKEGRLRESLGKFDKFLKENDAKRTRAQKKSLDERRVREQKEDEITVLRTNMAELTDVRERQGRSVETNLAYQRYLELLLETVEEFSEVKDIIARFDTLAATNSALLDRAREAQERTERDRSGFVHSTEEKNTTILNQNNEIAKLQSKLEHLQSRTTKLQSECDQTINNATQKSLLLGQIKMATNNLFQLVKSHVNNRLVATGSTVVQLEKIQQFILDLTNITSDMGGRGGGGGGGGMGVV